MSAPPPAYFVDHKRGEVNELKTLLSNPKLQKDQDRKREVIKKVTIVEHSTNSNPTRICPMHSNVISYRDISHMCLYGLFPL